MKKIITFLLFTIGIVGSTFSQSELTKLVEAGEKLKAEKDRYKKQLVDLQLNVENLLKQKKIGDRKIRQLNETLEAKVKEILVIRGKLSDIQFEYDKLMLEAKRLEDENKVLTSFVDSMKIEKEKLVKDLSDANEQIEGLSTKLVDANKEIQAANARIAAFDTRMEELGHSPIKISFVEVRVSNANQSVFATTGRLSRGYSFFKGIGAGWGSLNSDEVSVNLSMAYAFLSLKSSLGKEKMRFKYVEPDADIFEKIKPILSFQGGWALPIIKSDDSFYNKGGVYLGGDIGGLYNVNEKINPYISFGWNMHMIRHISKSMNSVEYLHKGYFLLGIYF